MEFGSGLQSGGGRSPIAGAPTFRRDILPIIQAKCALCHGPGRANPRDWSDYATIVALKAAIDRRVWEVRDMPMGGGLDEEQRKLFHRWIQEGAQEGTSPDAPAPDPNPNPNPTPTPTPTSPTPNPQIISFTGQIQSLFRTKCSMCHGAGRANPKDWTDYATAYSNRDLIDRRVWVNRDMPLGGGLTDQERSEVHQWIAAGAPQDPSPSGPPDPTPVPSPTGTATPGPEPTLPGRGPIPPEVRGIFQNHCIRCHRIGGPRPDLADDAEINLFARQIEEKTEPGSSHPFEDPVRLNETEIGQLRAWIRLAKGL